MKRCLNFALLLAFAAPLSACGISGGLKTPPPLWGEARVDQAVDDAATTAAGDVVEPDSNVSTDNPFDPENEDEFGYGVDVADTP